MIQRSQIGIVTVLYNPCPADLAQLMDMAASYQGVIIDNSPTAQFMDGETGLMNYIHNRNNKGIAEAQNQGLHFLMDKKRDITHIVFLDQDSRVSDDYPLSIAREFERISQSKKLAFLGPSVENVRTGKEYKSVIHHDQQCTDDGFVPRREVISSGGCTTIECLKVIGLNDARLFIDFVDFEWCWRANDQGYICGITRNLFMSHEVGRKSISIAGYLIIISAPGRYFYQFRNYLWLARRKYVPLQWKIATGIKHAARMFYFPLFVHSGGQCWKNMVKGIFAGLKR